MNLTIRTRLKVTALVAAGRSPLCSLRQAFHGYEESFAQAEAGKKIAEGCRLIEKDPAGLNLWRTSQGDFWAPASTKLGGLSMILAEQAVHAYEGARTRVKHGDVILDCGANIGVFTRSALDSGGHLVIAFEPFPPTAECFKRNLSAEIADGRVRLCEKGLWNRSGRLTLIIDPNNAGGNSFITRNDGAFEGDDLPVTTIDDVAGEFGLRRIDFIKMDIEAAEEKALNGAQNTLANFRPRLAIAVEHTPDRLRNAQDVIAAVKRARPDYNCDYGFCYESHSGLVLPELIYFY